MNLGFTFEQLRLDLVKGAAITNPDLYPTVIMYQYPGKDITVAGFTKMSYTISLQDMQRTDWRLV